MEGQVSAWYVPQVDRGSGQFCEKGEDCSKRHQRRFSTKGQVQDAGEDIVGASQPGGRHGAQKHQWPNTGWRFQDQNGKPSNGA